MRKLFCFIICLFGLSQLLRAQVSPIEVNDRFYHTVIGSGKVEVAEDSEKSIPDEKVPALKFKLQQSETANFGFKNSSYWFHFKVKNTSSRTQYEMIEVKNPNLDVVKLLMKIPDGRMVSCTSGDFFPFVQRPTSNKFVQFPLTLAPGAEADIYLNTQNSGEQFSVPISFGDVEYFAQADANEQMIFGMYFGCILFVLLLNAFFWFVLKDESTLHYLGYLAGLMMLQLSLTGIGFQYLWPESVYLANHANPIFASASVFFLILFVQKFLHTREFIPRINKLFVAARWLVAVDVVLATIPVQFCYITSVLSINVITFLLAIGIIPTSIYIYRKHYKPARFFIVAFIVLILSVFLFIFKNAGLVPSVPLTEYGLQLGSALEVLLLTLAVIDRFRQFQLDARQGLEEVNRLKTEANIVLEKKVEERTAEINLQKEKIEEINHEILSSIRYAKRIQEAILPPDEVMDDCLGEHFVFYQPRDIVSGDFYWVTSVTTTPAVGEKRKISLCAVADCTGHGVPGAFMSLIGSSYLKQSAHETGINSPAEALDFLNKNVIATLNQSPGENRVRDGMDISFVAIDRETRQMQFAAANNPIYLVRNGELRIFKADKQAIGSVSEEIKNYTNNIISLEKGDWIYLFTDGFADQFGGPAGKKFKYKPLQEELKLISTLGGKEQREKLRRIFSEWIGTREQIDDVCILGIRI